VHAISAAPHAMTTPGDARTAHANARHVVVNPGLQGLGIIHFAQAEQINKINDERR
jgi:hypothetical protein